LGGIRVFGDQEGTKFTFFHFSVNRVSHLNYLKSIGCDYGFTESYGFLEL